MKSLLMVGCQKSEAGPEKGIWHPNYSFTREELNYSKYIKHREWLSCFVNFYLLTIKLIPLYIFQHKFPEVGASNFYAQILRGCEKRQ